MIPLHLRPKGMAKIPAPMMVLRRLMEPDFIVARPMVAKVCYIDDREEPKVSWFVLNDSNVETRRC